MNRADPAAIVYFCDNPGALIGSEVIARSLTRARKLFPKATIVTNCEYFSPDISTDTSVAKTYEFVNYTPAVSQAQLLAAVSELCKEDEDFVGFFVGWSPLLDAGLCDEALQMHCDYLAEYTLSENLPPGMIPDFIAKRFIKGPVQTEVESIREFALKNINDFDVELYYRLPDLRQYRIDLSGVGARSERLVSDILRVNSDFQYNDLEGMLIENPEILRPFPSYIETEPTASMNGISNFLPQRKHASDAMLSQEYYAALLCDIIENGLNGDVVISFGGLGEPMLHPQLKTIVASFLKASQIKSVYIETYGSLLHRGTVLEYAHLEGSSKLSIILKLNTLRRERYENFFGVDHLPQIIENIKAVESIPEEKLSCQFYVEMIRMKDNSDEIDGFFERFKHSVFTPILQKYNSYGGKLPDRRLADLSPLQRDFCRHLCRDVYINAEGRIPVCKQDPFAEGAEVSSVRDQAISSYWQRSFPWHAASMRGQWDKIPMPCDSCDEWYTFNA